MEEITSLSDARRRLDSLSGAFLRWSGKVERRDIGVPTPPLFIHERHSANAVLNVMREKSAEPVQDDLFGDSGLDLSQRIDAYEHKGGWENRLIFGDSLQVMNSLVTRENLGREVQMIYFDPPYGVNFGSNFQPFVKETAVNDNNDASMTREPEMVTAFRDTWELGLHSYLTYVRDRLILARDLLTDSGSIFVQISDTNVHRVRQVMDEVFGAKNFVSQIWFQTSVQSTSSLLSRTGDFLLWYAKDRAEIHYNQIYLPNVRQHEVTGHTYVLLDNGDCRRPTQDEKNGAPFPKGSRLFIPNRMLSRGVSSNSKPQPFEFKGKKYHPPSGKQWRVKYPDGLNNLVDAGRIVGIGERLYYIDFQDEFPYRELMSVWPGTQRTAKKVYACQTSEKVIERCMHMTTEAGDIVLDITCGSGTTPVVAEKWGRRWIAVDISRVPVAIARQRLMTQVFDWIKLKDEEKGPSGGFVYKSEEDGGNGGMVKKVTPRSISKNEEPHYERIVDRPEVVKGVQRVCGPFTVESTIQPAASLDLLNNGTVAEILGESPSDNQDYENHIEHLSDVLSQVGNVAEAGEPKIEIENVSRIDGCMFLHSKCVCVKGNEKIDTAIAFGPKNSAIPANLVQEAATEAMHKGYQQFFMVGFGFDATARTAAEKMGIPTKCVEISYDMTMDDLLKKSKKSEIFTITGAPDVALERIGKDEFRVRMNGLDTYRFEDGRPKPIKGEDLPCWILDTDYNGMTFYGRHFFTPGFSTDATNFPWKRLRNAFRKEVDDDAWNDMKSTVSPTFRLGEHRRIAVMAIDPRGNSLMAIRHEEDAVAVKAEKGGK